MEWKELEGKNIFCKSEQGCYSGILLEFDDPFFIILDKYNNKVAIQKSQILKLVEEDIQNQPREVEFKKR
jgi:hypothetical protein